jgi:ubiquinone/menaquinone biosynthesis C-methylase UbiE
MNKHEQWHLSATAAELYERYVARYILGPWTASLVDAAHVATRERVLDVACGTGLVTRAAAERAGSAGRATGLDLNPAMIAVARSLPAPAAAPIEWVDGSALYLPLPDACFDVVLCQQGLQFFPDKPRALQEMRRVLVRGGRVALSVWNSVGVYNSALAEALAHYIGEETASRFLASRRAPGGEELHRLVTEAGFWAVDLRVSRIAVHLPRIDRFALNHLSATPIASVLTAADLETREQVGASVSKAMQQYADGDGVTYPEETFVLTAQVDGGETR